MYGALILPFDLDIVAALKTKPRMILSIVVFILVQALATASAPEDVKYQEIEKRLAELNEKMDELSRENPQSDPNFESRLRELHREFEKVWRGRFESRLRELHREFEKVWRGRFDFVAGRSDICPIHGIKMQAREVPVSYGMLAAKVPDPDRDTRNRLFPHAEQWILGGCVVSHDSPKTGKVYVCQKCLEAEKAWTEAHEK